MTPRQARMGADIFTFLVAASVGIALASVCWHLTADSRARSTIIPKTAPASRPIDINPLIALAPFGAGGAASAQAGNQPLTLRGILLAQPRAASSALISLGDAVPVSFFAGQTIGDATIDAIEVDHVVLMSGGVRSVLKFPDPAPVSGAAPPPPSVPAPAAPAPSTNAAAMLQSFGAVASGAGLAIGNPSAMMRLAGLQAGDQIVAVDGAPANELLHNPSLLQPILAAGSARIDIVRAGQPMTVSVPVR
jgi:general secretion pathway protein C